MSDLPRGSDQWEAYDGSWAVPMRHGFSMYLRPGCSHSERRFRYRVLEANELDVLASRDFVGFTCIDVGANVGYWSRFLLDRIGPTGAIHAFEPDPRSVAVLRRNLADPRGHVVEGAVGATRGTTTLYSDPTQSGLNSTLPFHGGLVFEVPIVSIDGYVADARITRVDFVKIDVQGGEIDVLHGAIATLERDRPCVYMEWTHSYDSVEGRVEYGLDHRARTAAMREQMEAMGPIYRITGGTFVAMSDGDWDSFEGNVVINPPPDWLGVSRRRGG